jgi:uncharacterized membrane protein YesL
MAEWRWRSPEDPLPAGQPEDPPAPSAKLALKRSVAFCYDYLGLTVFGSLLTSLIIGPVVVLILGLPIIVSPTPAAAALSAFLRVLLVLPLLTLVGAALVHMARHMLDRSDPSLLDLPRSFAARGASALKLGLINALILGVLWADIAFFASMPSPAARLFLVPLLYLALFWLMMALYQFPLLVGQSMPPVRCVKQASLLVLDNPLFTLLMVFVIIVVAGLSAVTRLPLVLVLPVWLAVVAESAFRELLRKYEALERQEPVEEA